MATKPKKTTNEPDDDEKKVDVEQATQLEPYPTGSPPDPREEFKKIHGFYPEKE